MRLWNREIVDEVTRFQSCKVNGGLNRPLSPRTARSPPYTPASAIFARVTATSIRAESQWWSGFQVSEWNPNDAQDSGQEKRSLIWHWPRNMMGRSGQVLRHNYNAWIQASPLQWVTHYHTHFKGKLYIHFLIHMNIIFQ